MSLKGFETRLATARVALFDQPKRIIFATGAVEQFVGSEAKRLGGKRVLVDTDKGVRKAGMADTVIDLLKKEKRALLVSSARDLKNRGVEVVLLACTGYATIGLAQDLKRSLDIPIVDPVLASAAATRYATSLS